MQTKRTDGAPTHIEVRGGSIFIDYFSLFIISTKIGKCYFDYTK